MPQITAWFDYGNNSDWVEKSVNVPWVVCRRCSGEGHHGHPAFDGTTQEYWDQQEPGDLDDYMSGAWDVTCEECHGRRVIPGEPEFDDPVEEAAYERAWKRIVYDREVEAMELRYCV